MAKGGATRWKKGQSGNPKGRRPASVELDYLRALRDAGSPERLQGVMEMLFNTAEDPGQAAKDRIAAGKAALQYYIGSKTLADLEQLEARLTGEPLADARAIYEWVAKTASDPRLLIAAAQGLDTLGGAGASLAAFLQSMQAVADPWAGHKPERAAADWRPEGEE